MSQVRHTKRRRWSAIVLICCLTLTMYFAHHAMYGRYGIESNSRLSAHTQELADKLAALKTERAHFDRDIALLRFPPHPDMIEEAARRVLGYAYPQSRIVTMSQ